MCEQIHLEMTDEDEAIINRGPVEWWKIEAGDHADYRVMLDSETNGQGLPAAGERR